MRERWSTPVVVIHWLSAALILALTAAGLVMSHLPADAAARLLLSRLHSVGGVALMLLTAARLFVRTRGGAPAPLPLEAPHRRLVGVVHGLIYATLFAIGATGALTGARSEWPHYLRGELGRAPALEAMTSRAAHEALVFTLLGLVAIHVAGVVIHQVRRGGALSRMLPSRAG